MSVVNKPYTFSANTNISSSQMNANFDTIYNDYNGGITSTNLANNAVTTAKIQDDAVTVDKIADGAITPAQLVTGAGSTWVTQAWTPTLSGRLDDADWTKECSYTQIGKMVICKFGLTATAAAPMGGGTADAIFSLPVTAVALTNTANVQVLGMANCFDANGSIYVSHFGLATTTTALVRFQDDAASGVIQGVITSTTPFTWTTSDEITGTFIYEAA